jgi:hypothetical protein
VFVFAPGRNFNDYPQGRNSLATVEEQIDAFYDIYNVWLLKIAEQVININDAGFAILLILNPYFEMIARYHRGLSAEEAKRQTANLVKEGFLLVFHELPGQPTLPETLVIEGLADALRHNIAHIGLTGRKILLSEDYQCALTVFFDPLTSEIKLFGINPRLWVQNIRNHFENYVRELHDPANVKLRDAFSRCFLKSV